MAVLSRGDDPPAVPDEEECGACLATGYFPLSSGVRLTCATCGGTGSRTSGLPLTRAEVVALFDTAYPPQLAAMLWDPALEGLSMPQFRAAVRRAGLRRQEALVRRRGG